MSQTNDKQLPKSPDDMPWAYSQDNPNWLRNLLVTLNNHSLVDIHWENDNRESNKTGEPAGEWEIEIHVGDGRVVKSKHEDIENALWFAEQQADEASQELWKKQDESRLAALAKLTVQEKALLGLRS